jgi:hypothetical protein
MKWLLAVVVLFAVALLVAAALRRTKRSNAEGVWPFIAKKVLSPPEQVLYFRLLHALPDHIVLAQVQLSRVLGVRKGNNYQTWLNRINQLSADFVVCAKDATVLAVVELDDASHQSERRREADARKTRAVEAAGLKLVRWSVSALPDDTAIRSTVLPNPTFNRTVSGGRPSAPTGTAG